MIRYVSWVYHRVSVTKKYKEKEETLARAARGETKPTMLRFRGYTFNVGYKNYEKKEDTLHDPRAPNKASSCITIASLDIKTKQIYRIIPRTFHWGNADCRIL